MITFKKFLNESLDFVPIEDPVDVVNSKSVGTINSKLASVLGAKYATSYIALQKIRKLLATYGIDMPAKNTVMHPDGDEDVFRISQYGKVFGQNLDGTIDKDPMTTISVRPKSQPLYLYFAYSVADDGFVEAYAEICNEKDLHNIMNTDDEENDDLAEEFEEKRQYVNMESFKEAVRKALERFNNNNS